MFQRLGLLLAFGLVAPAISAQHRIAGTGTSLTRPSTGIPAIVQPSGSAVGRPPDTLDVETVVRFVLDGPHVRAAAFNSDAYEAAIRAAGSLPQPTLSGTVYPVSTAGAAGPRAPAIQVSQQLPDAGARRARRASAVATAAAVEFHEEAFRADAAGSAMSAVVMLQRARDIRAALHAFLDRMKLFEEAAAVRYEVGNGPQSDVLLAQIDRGRVEARIELIQSEEDKHVFHLLALTHKPESMLRAAAYDPDMSIPLAVDLDSAATRSPTIRAVSAERGAAQADARAAEAAKRPSFGLHAMYSPMYTMPDGAGPLHAIGAGVSLTLPLRRDPLNARVEEAHARLNQADARAHLEAIHLHAAVQRQAGIIRRETEILRRYESELLPQADVMVESSLSSYVTGQTDFLHLLEAERRRLEIAIEAIDTRARVREAIATLYRELGRLPQGNRP
jgi:outer membrane protein TolC